MAQGLWAVFWPPDSAWEKLAPILEELSEKDRARFRAIPQDPRGDERRRQLLFSRALLPFALQETLLQHPKNSTETPAITSLSTAPTPPVPPTEHPFSAPPEIPAELAETLTFTGFTAPAHPADTPIPASPAALSEPAESLSFADVPAPVGGEKSLRASRFLALAKTPAGQPYLPGCPELFLSLSHTAGAAILAVSDAPVGVDIEFFRPVPRNLSRNFDGNGKDFWDSWTKAEAAAKRRGRGLDAVLPLARKGFPPPLDAREIPLPGPYAAAVSGTGPFPLRIVPPEAMFSAFSLKNDRK